MHVETLSSTTGTAGIILVPHRVTSVGKTNKTDNKGAGARAIDIE